MTTDSAREQALAKEGSQVQCDLLYTEKAHFAAAENLRRTFIGLGATSTTAAAAASAAIVKDHSDAAGVLALLAAVASALLTFLRLDQRAEAHLAAGRQLGTIRVELRQLMHLDLGYEPDQDVRDQIADIANRKADIDASSPGLTERNLQRASKKIQRGDFDDDAALEAPSPEPT